jgi:hypothetical protein
LALGFNELTDSGGGDFVSGSGNLLGAEIVLVLVEELGDPPLSHVQARLSVSLSFRTIRGIKHDSCTSEFIIQSMILALKVLRMKVNVSRMRSPNTTPCPTPSFIMYTLRFRGHPPSSFLRVSRR